MAKAASASTKPETRQQSANRRTDNQASADDGQSAPPAGDVVVRAEPESNETTKSIDLHELAKAHDALEQQLKFWTVAIEDTSRTWKQFGEQVAGASGELVQLRETETRLRNVDQELQRMSALHSEGKARSSALEAELAEARSRETAANERAAKFEEICEQIKERALEIHTALQATRASEQKLQSEQTAIRSELVELRRNAQEESAGRIAAEEHARRLQATIAELESTEAQARDRIAKLTEENKVMVQTLPQLVAEAGNWQKQFSASERENARMLAERKVSGERMGELEAEIRTLRADLASLATGHASALESVVVEPDEATPEIQSDDIDDLDLVSSLDRAFGRGELTDEPPLGDKKH